jgi:hypothetical protein
MMCVGSLKKCALHFIDDVHSYRGRIDCAYRKSVHRD